MSYDSRRDTRRAKYRHTIRTRETDTPDDAPAPDAQPEDPEAPRPTRASRRPATPNIKIDSHIPPPPPRSWDRVRRACETLAKANIGDSTFIEDVKTAIVTSRATRVGGPGWYSTQREGDGVRIWKTSEPGKGAGGHEH